MAKSWTRDEVLELMQGYQPACVLGAAAELNIFSSLKAGPATAESIAQQRHCDERAMSVLLDALAAIGLLDKDNSHYRLAGGTTEILTSDDGLNILGALRHHANCLRRWAQLARVVQSGLPAEREPSIAGESADLAAFISAMHEFSEPMASGLLEEIRHIQFRRVLDVGGASGTWTIALLRDHPDATAIIFDLPEVLPMAAQRIAAAGLGDRVNFAAGDFEVDELPTGADLAWVSAIIHMNSREENRTLFAKAFRALPAGGRILIRDIIVDESRTCPASGAMFAVNMLVATPGGGTFPFSELAADLQAAGFVEPLLIRHGMGMDSLVMATKPGT